MSNSDLKVFVSSTSEDLKDYRGVARSVINKMGWQADMMEDWGAMSTPTVQACYEKLKDCDLVVIIVAHKRGWMPSREQGGNGQDSITVLELACARQHNIPVLAFLAKDTWPGNLWENIDQGAREWIDNFRKGLNLPADFFGFEEPTAQATESLPGFRALLGNALVKYSKEHGPGSIGSIDLESASAMIRSGQCIPFLDTAFTGMDSPCAPW